MSTNDGSTMTDDIGDVWDDDSEQAALGIALNVRDGHILIQERTNEMRFPAIVAIEDGRLTDNPNIAVPWVRQVLRKVLDMWDELEQQESNS